MINTNPLIDVPLSHWDGGLYSFDDWELVMYEDYVGGIPKFAVIQRKEKSIDSGEV